MLNDFVANWEALCRVDNARRKGSKEDSTPVAHWNSVLTAWLEANHMLVGIGAALFNERGKLGGLFRVNKGEGLQKNKDFG